MNPKTTCQPRISLYPSIVQTSSEAHEEPNIGTTSDMSTSPSELANNSLQTLLLRDGRTLAYARYGATTSQATVPVFYFNGTPGSRLECQLVVQPASKLGIPLISTDRPGFGQSSWLNARTLLQWPRDVLELADHLGIDKFGVIGLSGGGPYVLACLHEIPPERLVAASIVSGMYPMSLGTTGMMWQTRLTFTLAYYSTWLAEKMIDLSMGSMLRNTERQKLIEQISKQTDALPQPQSDKDALKRITGDDVLIEAYLGSMKEALGSSSKGAAWEFWIFSSDYGFQLQELDGRRLTIWHGGLDVNVPIGMPNKAAQLIPNVKFNCLDLEGHISLIVERREQILSDLMERLSK
jgi:pimeloyl-ACP methyl ester carboxylesterase